MRKLVQVSHAEQKYSDYRDDADAAEVLEAYLRRGKLHRSRHGGRSLQAGRLQRCGSQT